MNIVAHNGTDETIEISDHYILDPELEGIEGDLEYSIPPRRKLPIRPSDFIEEWLQDMNTQKIHVKCGEKELFLLPEDLEKNKGKDVIFEIVEDSLYARFVPRREEEEEEEETLLQRIWKKLRFWS